MGIRVHRENKAEAKNVALSEGFMLAKEVVTFPSDSDPGDVYVGDPHAILCSCVYAPNVPQLKVFRDNKSS